MLIKIKARGYNRATSSFVDKWLDEAHLDDEAEVKELKKALCRLAIGEAKANRCTTFRLVILPDDEDEEGLIDFSSKPKKKSKKTVDLEDDDDDE